MSLVRWLIWSALSAMPGPYFMSSFFLYSPPHQIFDRSFETFIRLCFIQIKKYYNLTLNSSSYL